MRKPALAVILALALALRLVNAFFIPWQGGDRVISDMQGYDRAAVALLSAQPLAVHTTEGHLFHPLGSDTYHPPGYYYFLAGLYALAGHSFLAVRIAQAILDTLTCLFVYLIGRQVFGEQAGLLAAALAAFYPPFIFYTGVLLTETLSTCLLSAATWLLLRTAKSPGGGVGTWLLTGLLLGLAGLMRSVLLIVIPLALFWSCFIAARWPGWRETVRRAAMLAVPVVLVIAPITWRNYQIHHKLILVSTNGGVNFFLGHGGSERLKNEVRHIPATYSEGQLVGISPLTEPEEEALFYQLGWGYIRQHPARTLLALPGKLREMYWDSDYWPATDAQAAILRAIDWVYWKLLLLPAALLGLLLWLGTGFPAHQHGPVAPGDEIALGDTALRRAALLYLFIASSLSIPLLFWAQTRFRVPFVPAVVVLAAGTLHEVFRRVTRRGQVVTGERQV